MNYVKPLSYQGVMRLGQGIVSDLHEATQFHQSAASSTPRPTTYQGRGYTEEGEFHLHDVLLDLC